MFIIKAPAQYQQTLWKNGKGTTTELAINDGGNLTNFDWRISIASVVENGVFSDFSGLRRDLFLLTGAGLTLIHDQGKSCETVHQLKRSLDYATFDGGSRTEGQLHDGAITDFNLMTRQDRYQVNIMTFDQETSWSLPEQGLCFIYPLANEISLDIKDHQTTAISKHHLLIAEQGFKSATLRASNTIFIQLLSLEPQLSI